VISFLFAACVTEKVEPIVPGGEIVVVYGARGEGEIEPCG